MFKKALSPKILCGHAAVWTVCLGREAYSYIFRCRDVPPNRVSFSRFGLWDRVSYFVKICFMTGSIFVIFYSERPF